MTDRNSPSLARLLEQLRFQLAEPVDFTRTDADATVLKVRLLSAAAVYFNVLTIAEFGGRPGPVRHEGLVEQIVAAAFQTYLQEDPHPHPFDKAAMLLRGIIQGHPFADANKRTGFLLSIYYLDRVGFVLRPELSRTDIVTFCQRVSAGEVRDLATMATALQEWTEPLPDQPQAKSI